MLFRACIELPEVNGDPLTKEKLEAMTGFKSMRFYGPLTPHKQTESTFMLIEFDIDNYEDIGDIQAQLVEFNPVYCFNTTCIGATRGCPAFDR